MTVIASGILPASNNYSIYNIESGGYIIDGYSCIGYCYYSWMIVTRSANKSYCFDYLRAPFLGRLIISFYSL